MLRCLGLFRLGSAILMGFLVLSACSDDDGGGNDNTNNNNNVNSMGVCGDGRQDPPEDCDQGTENSDAVPDTCRTDCRNPWCGDGVVDTGEECDDGNGENGDACLSACSGTVDCCVHNVCGDGYVDARDTGDGSQVEACDDGNTLNGDTCRADCGQAMTDCGDGLPDQGEVCDEGALNSNTVPNACRKSCQLPFCGDGVVDDEFNETCDSTILDNDCTTIGMGFTHGVLSCGVTTCRFDTSGCVQCADVDRDGFGVGADCLGPQDCDDLKPDVSPDGTELCDGLDHDCDGDPMNGFDLWTDVNNCGSCGHVCYYPHAEATCDASACQMGACEDGYCNTNGVENDGCEASCT